MSTPLPNLNRKRATLSGRNELSPQCFIRRDRSQLLCYSLFAGFRYCAFRVCSGDGGQGRDGKHCPGAVRRRLPRRSGARARLLLLAARLLRAPVWADRSGLERPGSRGLVRRNARVAPRAAGLARGAPAAGRIGRIPRRGLHRRIRLSSALGQIAGRFRARRDRRQATRRRPGTAPDHAAALEEPPEFVRTVGRLRLLGLSHDGNDVQRRANPRRGRAGARRFPELPRGTGDRAAGDARSAGAIPGFRLGGPRPERRYDGKSRLTQTGARAMACLANASRADELRVPGRVALRERAALRLRQARRVRPYLQ